MQVRGINGAEGCCCGNGIVKRLPGCLGLPCYGLMIHRPPTQHCPWLQEAVSAGRLVGTEAGARAGGVSKEDHNVMIRGWLLAHLRLEEQQALCRLWVFRGGFGLEAAQAMLRSSSQTRAVQATLRGLMGTSCLQLGALPAAAGSAQRYSMHVAVG